LAVEDARTPENGESLREPGGAVRPLANDNADQHGDKQNDDYDAQSYQPRATRSVWRLRGVVFA